MEKRPNLFLLLSVLLLASSNMPLMASESKLQANMKSFSTAVNNFKGLVKKCRSVQGCSQEEQRTLRRQVATIAATAGAIVLLLAGGTLRYYLGRRPAQLESGRSSAVPYVEGQDWMTKEAQRRATLEHQKIRYQQGKQVAKDLLMQNLEAAIATKEEQRRLKKQQEEEVKEERRKIREEKELRDEEARLEKEQFIQDLEIQKRMGNLSASETAQRIKNWEAEQKRIRRDLGTVFVQ